MSSWPHNLTTPHHVHNSDPLITHQANTTSLLTLFHTHHVHISASALLTTCLADHITQPHLTTHHANTTSLFTLCHIHLICNSATTKLSLSHYTRKPHLTVIHSLPHSAHSQLSLSLAHYTTLHNLATPHYDLAHLLHLTNNTSLATHTHTLTLQTHSKKHIHT